MVYDLFGTCNMYTIETRGVADILSGFIQLISYLHTHYDLLIIPKSSTKKSTIFNVILMGTVILFHSILYHHIFRQNV